jgi:hypothetical protein
MTEANGGILQLPMGAGGCENIEQPTTTTNNNNLFLLSLGL